MTVAGRTDRDGWREDLMDGFVEERAARIDQPVTTTRTVGARRPGRDTAAAEEAPAWRG
jgi:hypothetical protein